jgi:hypothetical protein
MRAFTAHLKNIISDMPFQLSLSIGRNVLSWLVPTSFNETLHHLKLLNADWNKGDYHERLRRQNCTILETE